MKEKILVIVAHPDDETIWMGGLLLKNLGKWNTTIFSLCRKNDKDRAPKFKRVCNIYNAESYMSDLEDEKLNKIPPKEVKKRLKKFSGKYDKIFTHNKNGEYGHIRHKDVHNAVNEMIKEKKLSCRQLFYFSYQKKGKYAYPKKNSDKFINLAKNLTEKKKVIIRDVYGFNKGGFEDLCCRGKEAFNIKRVK
jgi:LmbE family N-acetylglucosaminyl deacetylase|tara:strand:+ start:156 stop:731 length:576 start_codon:yes stop_codon:yes gene_type:complete